MLQNAPWTHLIGKGLSRTGHWLRAVLAQDLSDSKWGHRVMDQIFREGKFTRPDHK